MRTFYKKVAIQEGETMAVYEFIVSYKTLFEPLPTIYINGVKSTIEELNKVENYNLIGEFIYYYEEDRGTELWYCIKK